MKQVAYVLAGVLVGFILAGALFMVTRAPAGKPIVLEPPPTKVPIEVQVIGGVVRPGVYALPEGSRVQDAVEAAGGLLADVDASSINLAARLQDGQQVQIPGGQAQGASTPSGGSAFTVIQTPRPTATPSSQGDLIDINTATLAELQSLPNIGPTTAQNIINYRNQHGPFAAIEDVMNVPGVGPATFDQIQDLITVGG
jgi:competence protein ComEA